MTVSRRTLARLLAFGLSGFLSPAALGSGGSASVKGHHSRARLLAGGSADASGVFLAGVQIELDAGFKTYWRNPGESGLPPAFDWAGSENVADVTVFWPAPTRFEDPSGVSYGYLKAVIFPLRVVVGEPGRPARLSMKLDYGVCKDVCIPAHAALTLALADGVEPSERALLEQALARVPKPTPLGSGEALAILTVRPDPQAGDRLLVTARTPVGLASRLFAEGPADWFLADAGIENFTALAGVGLGEYRVRVLERPRTAPAEVELRLTLVAGDRSIETAALLDTASLAR